MTAGRMKITTVQASEPDNVDWAHMPVTWVSLTNVRLDGGFLFTKATIPVEPLFAEVYREATPRMLDLNGQMTVLSGEITVVRAILDGKSGLEALVYKV